MKTVNPKPTNALVDLCLGIALKAHAGQADLDGNPVILHPLAVGLAGKTPDQQCAGFLHDVVEDTDYTFDNLLDAGVPDHIVDALRLLTHDENEDYTDYVTRIARSGNSLAIAVKLNDLNHNLERGRRMGYHRLVAKHEAALAIITSSRITTTDFAPESNKRTPATP